MTPQQSRLYNWLLERIDEPVCPSMVEMADALGLSSKANIHRLLGALREQGRVVMTPNRERTVRAVRMRPLDGIPSSALIDELKRRGEWK